MTRLSATAVPEPQAIARLTDEVFAFLRQRDVDARTIHHVGLVIDELLTNVAEHGGSKAEAEVTIEVLPDRVIGEIRDHGAAYDPRSAAPPDVDAAAEDRAIGGLGLHLVKTLTAALDYRREGSQNWTEFCILRRQENSQGVSAAER